MDPRNTAARAAFVFAAAGVALLARAQECTATAVEGGGYKVTIAGTEYYALTQKAVKATEAAFASQKTAEENLARAEKMIAQYKELSTQYEATMARQKEYVAELEHTLQGYRDLVAQYRELKEPWLTVEGGIGLTGKDTQPAVMLGLGIRSLRLWGFAQKDNTGAMAGISLPLF
jgi:hypothetical protein